MINYDYEFLGTGFRKNAYEFLGTDIRKTMIEL